MESVSSSFKSYSHPDKLLIKHLFSVADRSVETFLEIKHNLDKFLDKDIWEKLVWLTGFSHDIGKATSYFQNYLFEEDLDKKNSLKNKDETHHSLISAVITHIIAKKFIQNLANDDFLNLMPFFLFLIVKKHHGNINNFIPKGDNDNELDTKIDFLNNQFNALNKEEFEAFLKIINDKLNITIQLSHFPNSLVDYYKKQIRRKEKNFFRDLKKKTDYYLIFMFLYSILLFSDKTDAIFENEINKERKNPNVNIVENYKATHFGKAVKKIDKIREEIFNTANKRIVSAPIKQKIFSLNVPTGSGKTLTALSVALKLREKLKKDFLPRIVYALPFTSIIDQNFAVFEEIFNHPDSTLLIKHHHLAEINYKNRYSEFEADQSKFLIESWNSEIIVTTFFQVFHTFFTNRNRMIQKFHKLANAIILLDEIQTLPYKYWKLAKNFIERFSELFNSYFILITATQPEIFDKDQIYELVPQKNEIFKKFDRINLYFEKEQITLNDFKKLCIKEISQTDESFLFVLNTINSSLEIYNEIEQNFSELNPVYLATNIIPKHRLERIRNIKKEKGRKIIVSTQLIEAGVDIDVENVWRDFAPLESINQVSGRCNRNFSQQKGKVRIFEILDGNNTPFSKYIYGKSPLGLIETKSALGNNAEISEAKFLENLNAYYKILKEKISNDESNDILQFINEMRFADIYDTFKLINDKYYKKKDVFIEFDEKAIEIWQKFIELREIKDFFKRKTEFLKFRKDFYDYVISVPEKYLKGMDVYNENNLVYIPNDSISFYYNKKTGWIRTEDNFDAYVL